MRTETMPASSILDDIAKVTKEVRPTDHKDIPSFVRKVAKNAVAAHWGKFKPDTFSYMTQVQKAVKTKQAVPLPPDLDKESVPEEKTEEQAPDTVQEATPEVEVPKEEVEAEKSIKEKKAKEPKPPKEPKVKSEKKVTKKMLKRLEKKQLLDDNGNPIEPTEKEILPDNMKVDSSQFPITVSELLSMFEKGHLTLPSYQRKPVWKKDMREEFIESIIIGIPVPMMFFAVDPTKEDNIRSLIDGCQRLNTLKLFKDGYVLLNGWTYDQLPEAIKNRFLYDIKIPITEVKSEKRFHSVIFRKLNRGGVPLNAMEIRRATYDDEEILFKLNEMADTNQVWKELFGQNIRFKGLAVLLGAKAMHFQYPEYKKPKDQFLDNFCEGVPQLKENGTITIDQLLVEVDNILHACREVIGKNAFRISEGNQPNAGLVECLIHSGLTVLANKPTISIERLGNIIKEVRSDLLVNVTTYDALTKDTSGREKVQTRMSATEKLTLERLG